MGEYEAQPLRSENWTRTVGDDVYQSTAETSAVILLALKKLDNWDHRRVLTTVTLNRYDNQYSTYEV
jgi:hypothetical protein